MSHISNSTQKLFALVDCNNFYASCERVFRPELRKKPIVILSNNDGCIIARSNEAKALGIVMGAPYFKHKDFIKKNNVRILDKNIDTDCIMTIALNNITEVNFRNSFESKIEIT